MALLYLFDSFTVHKHFSLFSPLSVCLIFGFPLRSSFLQLHEVITLDIPPECFPLAAYKTVFIFRRSRGWEACKEIMKVPMLSGIAYHHKLQRRRFRFCKANIQRCYIVCSNDIQRVGRCLNSSLKLSLNPKPVAYHIVS